MTTPAKPPVTAAMLRALRELSPHQTSEEAYAQMRASLAASSACNRAEIADGTHPSRMPKPTEDP